MGYTGSYENAPTYPGSVSRRCPDITKAKAELDYLPKISLEEWVRQTVLWYQSFYDSGNEILSGGFKPPEALNYSR
jgi:nucleoside-diphosphate-sugar epimerase